MTSETKRFIELSDIVGLRLLCRSCGCSLLVDIEREDGPVVNLISSTTSTLMKCPTCGEGWTQFRERGGDPWDSEVKEFLRKMRFLRQIESKFGFALALEIKDEKKNYD
jgi:hypothetical protein